MSMQSGSIPGGRASVTLPQDAPLTPPPAGGEGTAAPQGGIPQTGSFDPNAAQTQLKDLLARAGLERTPDGVVVVRDTAEVGKVGTVSGRMTSERITGQTPTRIEPPTVPTVKMTDDLRQGGISWANNMNTALDEVLLRPGAIEGSGNNVPVRNIAELNGDDMMAAFLKLQFMDPNNSVETHSKLHSVMSECRKIGINEALKKSEQAQKMMKEAEQLAGILNVVMILVSIILIIIAIVVAVFTFGAGTAAVVGAVAAAGFLIGLAASKGDLSAGLMGASIGAAVATLGAGIAVAAAAASAQASVTAAAQAASEAAKEVVRETMQEASRQVVQQIVQEATQKALQELAQRAAKEGIQEITQEMVQQAVEQAVKEALQKAVQEGTLQMSQEAINQVAQQSAQAAARTGVEKTLTTMAKEIAETAAKEGAKRVGQMANNFAQAAGTAGRGGAEYAIAKKNIEAQEANLAADRFRKLAEEAQKQLEEENEIINMILESKNKTVDAVIAMMNASHASKLKLMSAGAAK